MQNKLRQQVKILKALQGINYKELALYIEITHNSFYSWLNGYYNLSIEKAERLQQVIDTLKIEV